MTVPREYTDRDEVQVAILQALVDRPEEGLTVFELRTHVGENIDDIETALSALKRDGLIEVHDGAREGGNAVIKPADRVVPLGDDGADESTLDRLRERLPF